MKKVIIQTKGKTFLVGMHDILYCKAAGSYSVIFLNTKEEIVTSMNLLNLHEKLKCFSAIFRTGRSFLVNINYIRCIHHAVKEVELCDGMMIPYTVTAKDIEDELIKISIL